MSILDFTNITKAEPPVDTSELKDFWAIVVLDFNEEMGDAEAYMLRQSADSKACDCFTDGLMTSDNGDDFKWVKSGMKSGVYKITFNPYGDEDSFDLNVTASEMLWELPA